jgi:hypothetical protein
VSSRAASAAAASKLFHAVLASRQLEEDAYVDISGTPIHYLDVCRR